ncbi:hypothetical protein, partial [Senegalimassilia anaerobia]|uniref:hypothetical protein n=1 Tax=Senegalimassilia anaerobia TaxID=1473216 RepID=UPI003A91F9A9
LFPSVVVNQRIGEPVPFLRAGSSGGLAAALIADAAYAAPPETLRRDNPSMPLGLPELALRVGGFLR